MHLRIAPRRVHAPPLDLADQRDLTCRVRTILGNAFLEFLDLGFIRETNHRDALHGALLAGGRWSGACASSIACEFSTLEDARSAHRSASDRFRAGRTRDRRSSGIFGARMHS